MLIIGGGDGGVLREVVKNPLVESVVLCEIDEVCSPVARSLGSAHRRLRSSTLQLLQNRDAHPLVLVLSAVQDVINVSKKYLPGMAKGFFSPKLTLHVGDGFEFMKQNQDAFDVIITDSSDPVGKRFLRSLVYRLVTSGACR